MSKRPKIGVLFSRVRIEEKWIFAAFEQRGIDYDRLDNRRVQFDLSDPSCWMQYDVILERSINYSRGLYALRILNAWGIPTVNTAKVAEICGDKIATTTTLTQAGIPQPVTKIAFTPEAALRAIESIGYPVVLKPAVGSWGHCLQKSMTVKPRKPSWNIKRRSAPTSTPSSTSRNTSPNRTGTSAWGSSTIK